MQRILKTNEPKSTLFFTTLLPMIDFMKGNGKTLIRMSHQHQIHGNKELEQSGNLAVGRATLVQSGARSIQRQYHNPPPTASIQQIIASEHSH